MNSFVSERRAFLAVLVILGVFFLFLLKPVFWALVLAVILTILLYPLYTFLLRILKGRKRIASFTATFIIFLTLVLPFSWIAVLVVNQVLEILPNLDINELLTTINSKGFYQDHILPLIAQVESALGIQISMADVASKVGSEAARTAYSFSPQVVGQTAYFIFSFFVMHFSIYFLFIEGKELAKVLFDLSPLQQKHELSLTREFKNMIDATVYGYLLTALVQATLAAIGFAIAGVKGFLILGTLTFFMSLVPILGATSVWLPVAIWYLIKGETFWAVFLGIYGGLIVSGIDNIIKPIIMRGKAKVHILLIFFSLIGGLKLFGPIGILMGPVITALFLASIRIYREDFLHKPPESI